jgi:hypothetical protein
MQPLIFFPYRTTNSLFTRAGYQPLGALNTLYLQEMLQTEKVSTSELFQESVQQEIDFIGEERAQTALLVDTLKVRSMFNCWIY